MRKLDPKKHPKAQHYLVIAEHIQTLFIYVYMVEFVKKYPGMKGTRFEDNAASRHDRENNLFTFLSHADYRKYFFHADTFLQSIPGFREWKENRMICPMGIKILI